MRAAIAALVAIVVVVALPGAARADGSFLEAAVGVAVPIAEDSYANDLDESIKVAVRAGSGPARRGSFEVGLDWTPVNTTEVTGFDIDIHRFRFLLGGRFGGPVGTKARAFGRVAAGVDLVDASARGQILGVQFDVEERDIGLALELGGGIAVDLGSFAIGGQVALPLAFHFDEDDPNDNSDFDLEYTGVDLDFLVFISFGL